MDYYDYEDFENCYEATQADEIFEEAMDKFKDILKEEVKNNLKSIQEENTKLRQENKEMKDKVRDIANRERDITYRESELERKTEYDFYHKKFSDILKPFENQMDMWYAERSYQLIPKCNLCNDEREIEYKSPTGKTTWGKCDCDTTKSVFIIKQAQISYLSLYKTTRPERKFVLSPKYEKDSYNSEYCKLESQQLADVFEIDKASEYNYYSGWGVFTGFSNKEECQKYCDWLNNNKNKEPIEDEDSDEFECEKNTKPKKKPKGGK